MKKKDLDYTKLVMYNGELVKVVDIGKREITIERENGKRQYIDAGSLHPPIVYVTVPLRLEIEMDEDAWHISCPQLKGFHTAGKTFKECLKVATDAGEGFLRSVIKHYNEET